MEAPSCNNKRYKNFTVDKKFCKANKVHSVFSSVVLKNWCDFDVIVPNIVAANSSASFKKYSESLDEISKKLIRHPYVQSYAFRVQKYLKNDHVRALYNQTFEDQQQKVERQRSKKRLNHANELLSHAELTLESTESLSGVNKRIKSIQDSMGTVHDVSSTETEQVINIDEAMNTEDPIMSEDIDNIKDNNATSVTSNSKKKEKMTKALYLMLVKNFIIGIKLAIN